MKIFARALTLFLALLLALSLISCDKKEDEEKDLDVDLSVMNEQSAYSQLCMIGNYNEAFVDSKITAAGTVALDTTAGTKYYCAVGDGTGCCFAYLEFVLAEGETYPEAGAAVKVEGVFDGSYDEYKENLFCGRIINAKIIG